MIKHLEWEKVRSPSFGADGFTLSAARYVKRSQLQRRGDNNRHYILDVLDCIVNPKNRFDLVSLTNKMLTQLWPCLCHLHAQGSTWQH